MQQSVDGAPPRPTTRHAMNAIHAPPPAARHVRHPGRRAAPRRSDSSPPPATRATHAPSHAAMPRMRQAFLRCWPPRLWQPCGATPPTPAASSRARQFRTPYSQDGARAALLVATPPTRAMLAARRDVSSTRPQKSLPCADYAPQLLHAPRPPIADAAPPSASCVGQRASSVAQLAARCAPSATHATHAARPCA